MTNSKNTKRALLLSVLSMMLCFAMLAGSTFAWFTDSVKSGTNKIVAGNLDVELYHANGKVTTAEKVAETTKLFVDENGEAILWEPGVMTYENFTVKNEGTLALKYKLEMSVGAFNTVAGTTDSLKDVLKVAVLDEAFTGDRADVEGLTFTSLAGLSEVPVTTGSEAPQLAAGAEGDTYAVVIYWEPTENDNHYNLNNGAVSSDGQPLFLDLGVALVATQVPAESDAFDNQYDQNAEFPFASTVAQLNSTMTIEDIPLAAGSETKHVPVEIPVGTLEAAPIEYNEHSTGYTGAGVMLGSTNLNGYGRAPAAAGDYTFIFKDGTITSQATGYSSIDNCTDSAVYLLLPGNSDVVFENVHFENVISFGVQMYTSPWSYLNSITFKNCTFDGILVGGCPAVHAIFDGCTFNNYTNTDYANNSNPIWWRASTGYWGEGAAASIHSMDTFTFVNNTVTSTRPVKIERIGQGVVEIGYTPRITILDNAFDISAQPGDTSHKNMAINIGQFDANSKFILIDDGNGISANTASLYTAALSSGSNRYIPVSGTQILDRNGNNKSIVAVVWKSETGTDTFTMETIE